MSTIHSFFTRYLAFSLCLILLPGFASSIYAADLRVMKTGLGKGYIQGTGISCGILSTDVLTDTDTVDTSCTATSTTSITLTAINLSGSTFTGWGGDCTGTSPTCTVPMNTMRSVRANFAAAAIIPPLTDLTPAGINTYLAGVGRNVNTQAEFIAALPQEFRQNWILMTRSESLQTGTSDLPRILLVSENAEYAFTLGLAEHSSYPGSHPNAIEYMQWDNTEKNFRFHEIVVDAIPDMDEITPGVFRFPARPTRQLKEDDPKCFACHSTQNVLNRGATVGTTGNPIGLVKFKSKPNWDTYDSWGGMLAFNRDRIYQGSIEAAAFRKIMNLWSWQTNEAVRSVIEQLDLQPPGVIPRDTITRWDTTANQGGPNDGHIHFAFDPAFPTVINEPIATGGPNTSVAYTFERVTPNGVASDVNRDNVFAVLQHTNNNPSTRFGEDEGRGTNFFNNLYLGLNPQRIVDEITPPTYATGSVPIDVRPIALAIASGCITVTGSTDPGALQTISGVTVPAFFAARNGMNFNDLYDDTYRRAASTSRRKADIQKLNLDRDGDVYVDNSAGADSTLGLIDKYESDTDGIVSAAPAANKRLRQLRQEVFRRSIGSGGGVADQTAMNGIFVDREDYGVNTKAISLYRYFLEPLGISVDR